MTAWVYRVETLNTEYDGEIDNSPSGAEIIRNMLDELGSEGWEAVAFVPAVPDRHFKGEGKNHWMFHVVFKRPSPALE